MNENEDNIAELIFFLRGNKSKSKPFIEKTKLKIKNNFIKNFKQRTNPKNWSFDELIEKTVGSDRRSICSTPKSNSTPVYDCVLSPISSVASYSRSINFDQDFILESPNGRLSNCPSPTRTNNSQRQLKRIGIERNPNSEHNASSNSERTNEELLSVESTKHKKRPKLSFTTFTSRIDPVPVAVCTSSSPHVATSGPIFPSLSLISTSFPVENMKSENTQTSPIILPRTRSLSVSTDFTDDLPLIRLMRSSNDEDSGVSCNCKLNSINESLQVMSHGNDVIHKQSAIQTDVSVQTEKVKTTSTDAGSTWFQMVQLADPLDYPTKYIASRSSSTQFNELKDNPFSTKKG
jgi:hypothetical protein